MSAWLGEQIDRWVGITVHVGGYVSDGWLSGWVAE